MSQLEKGLDFRDFPDLDALPVEGPATSAALRAYRNREAYGGLRLSPEKAAALVNRALYITRKGFNAFKLAEARNWAAEVADAEDEARQQGASPLRAREIAMQALGYEDERSFRRAKSGKRRGRGKPSP